MAQDTNQPSRETRSEPAVSGEAWQPCSFSGVAAFARAPLKRLLTVQLAVALSGSAVFLWFLQIAWLPVIEKSLIELPEAGGIQEGTLRWGGEPKVVLDYNRFLAISVSLDGEVGFQDRSDLQVTLERRGFRVMTLWGGLQLPYGNGWRLPLTRRDLEPWWLAWQPAMAVLGFAGFALFLLMTWTILSVLYSVPGRLLVMLFRRDLPGPGLRRLCGAALLPGGLVMSMALLFYGTGWFAGLFHHPVWNGNVPDLMGYEAGRQNFTALLLAFALHWVIGWIYVLGGILRQPAAVRSRPANSPFADSSRSISAKGRRSRNPFQTR